MNRVSHAPLRRTAWRRIRRRPLQYLLLIIGVALGVAMMVSIDVANSSASRAFQLSTDAVAGRATHRLVGGPMGLDETFYTRLRREVGYSPAAPVVEGYVVALDMGEQPLRLAGVDPFAEAPFRSYFVTEEEGMGDGLIPFLTQPNGVLLSRELAERYGLALGETMRLLRGGREIDVLVVGLLEPADALSRQTLNSLIFSDIATAQELLAMQGRLSHIDLIADDDEALAPLTAILPPDITLEPAAARSAALQQMTAAFELNLTALSLLALVVGMFLIYNSVTFSVVQRRRLFGILRCLGVTGGQLFSLIVVEAALFGLIGALLGLGLGVLLGRAMVGLVTQTINDLYFVLNVQSVTVPAWTLWKGLLTGVGAAVLASLAPALEAMRTTPQSALRRSSLESRSRRALPWLALGSLLLALLGGLLLWLPGNNLVIAFAGLFILLFGMALLTPAVTALLMPAVAPICGRLFGVVGRMAARDIVRSLSRTSVAIAALMVAVSVIVGVSIMIGSFRGAVSQWLDNTLRADVYLSPPALTGGQVQDPLDPEIIAVAGSWPGARQAVTAHTVSVMAPQWGRPVDLVSVSGDVSNGNRSYLWVDGREETLWDRLAAGEGILISEPLFRGEGLALPPPPVTLMTTGGPRSFPVLAIYYDYTSDQGAALIDRELFRAEWQDERITSLALFLDEEEDAEEMVAALQERFRGRQDVIIQSNRALRASALDVFDRTFAITAALQLLAVAVAFIGVLSALMSLQLERARELGVLRATGMSLGQMWRLTLVQTGLMGGAAGLLAMPAGWVLAWVLIYVINLRSFGWTMSMSLDPIYFIQAFLVALAAALLAGVYPALRLGQMEIAAAIRQE